MNMIENDTPIVRKDINMICDTHPRFVRTFSLPVRRVSFPSRSVGPLHSPVSLSRDVGPEHPDQHTTCEADTSGGALPDHVAGRRFSLRRACWK